MRRRLALACPMAFTILLAPIAAHALTIVTHIEHYDAASQSFHFSITFSGPPDFFTVDEFGRNLDAFQYWFNWDLYPGDPFHPLGMCDVLARGPEIRFGAGIPIRDRTGNGGPNAGGWGTLRGTVPYQLVGSTIDFDVPQAMMGDPDGKVAYYLGVFRFGGTTDQRTGNSDESPVPTAPASWGRLKRLYR